VVGRQPFAGGFQQEQQHEAPFGQAMGRQQRGAVTVDARSQGQGLEAQPHAVHVVQLAAFGLGQQGLVFLFELHAASIQYGG